MVGQQGVYPVSTRGSVKASCNITTMYFYVSDVTTLYCYVFHLFCLCACIIIYAFRNHFGSRQVAKLAPVVCLWDGSVFCFHALPMSDTSKDTRWDQCM
jgi:hypothetical protein